MKLDSCHLKQDTKSLRLAQAVVDCIESSSIDSGIKTAQKNLKQWMKKGSKACYYEWEILLNSSWVEIKKQYLSENERGQELRQNSPFCGILKPHERWQVLKKI